MSSGATAARAVTRWALVVVLAGAALLLSATTASAHATLLTSTPGNGDVLDEAPVEVTLTFTESVALGAGYLRVLDADGDRVDTGNVQVDGDTAAVPLQADLPDGGYIISYRVVSADSHPVSGGISFAVGEAEPPSVDSHGTRIDGSSDDPAVAVLYPVVRWIGYAGIALVGGVLLMSLIDPALRAATRSRTLGWVGFDLMLAGTLAAGLLQGPYAAGRGIGSVLDPSLLAATLETTAGQLTALRLMVLGALGIGLWEWFNAQRDRRALTWTAVGAVVAIAVTHVAGGHAAADGMPWLSIPVTSAHLVAVAGWIGGLVLMLTVVTGPRSPLGDPEQRAVAGRFSTIAGWLVGVVVLTGLVEAWVRVGSWGALFGTSYGQLLLAKTVLLVVALGAAVLSRRLVGHSRAGRAPDGETEEAAGEDAARQPSGTGGGLRGGGDRRRGGFGNRLRRTVLIEAVAGAVAIALAAVLVATPPAKDTYAVAEDTVVTFANRYTAQVSLDPARTGTNTLHLYLFDRNNALAAGVEELAVTVSQPVAQIGPLELDAQHVGQGHFIASGVELPAEGTWTVTITFTEPGFGPVTDEGNIDVG